MNAKEDRFGIENLLFRMEKFDDKVDELKWLISGTKGKYLDLIRTKTGRISTKRLDTLIDGLMACLGEVCEYNAKIHPDHVTTGAPEAKKKKPADGFTQKEETFFRSYWYLLLGLSTYDNPIYLGLGAPFERIRHQGTWDAMIERAQEKISYRTSAELTRALLVYHAVQANDIPDYDLSYLPEGLFYDIMDASHILRVQEKLIKQLPAADKKAARALMTDDEKRILDDPGAVLSDFWQAQKDMEEAWEKVRDEMIPWEELEEDDMEYDLDLPPDENDERTVYVRYTSSEDWVNFFTDRERFFDCCKNVCRLYAEVGAKCALDKEIPLAIRYYLSKNGLSDWMNDDRFFTVYTYLKKAERISRAEISGG